MTPHATPSGAAALPPAGDLSSTLESISWFDWTAIAVVLVFLVLGIRRGLGWQLTRLAMLVAAYVVAIVAAPRIAPSFARWFDKVGDPELPQHLALAAGFIATLALLGLVGWLLRSREPAPARTPANRLLGGAFGSLVGALAMLALLTGLQMFFAGRGIARAAEDSATSRAGQRVLGAAERVLPEPLSSGAREWRAILRDPELIEPVDAAAADQRR